MWRDGLWQQMLEYNIYGRCYRLIKHMCNNIKSSVMVNGEITNYFACNFYARAKGKSCMLGKPEGALLETGFDNSYF